MNVQQILKKLISFTTLSLDHKANSRALSWISGQMKGLPVFTRSFTFKRFPSLVISTKKTKRPKILLAGHLDVVSGSLSIMRPRVSGDKLFGRGAFDMKFAIASYIKLFQDLGRNLRNHDLAIMITTDEEIGGENGTVKLIEKGYLPEVCVLPDGGQNWEMQKGGKGILRLKVTASGLSAHGSRPWVGENAIDKLSDYLTSLRSQFVSEPCRDPEHEHATLNVGRISGGQEINLIPDSASAHLDVRYLAGKMPKILPKPGIAVEVQGSGDAFSFDLNNLHIRRFAGLIKKQVGIKPIFITTHGSSDARFFAVRGIPVIATRPIGGGHHTELEWISRKSLNAFYLVLKEFILSS